MKYVFLWVVVISLCISACNSDDDNIQTHIDTQLEASWDMTRYSFFTSSNPVFETGDVTWTFDNDTNKLTIVNNILHLFPYLPPSGTYTFSTFNTNKLRITRINLENYEYRFDDNELVLTYEDDPEIADDELGIRFTRL